MAGRNAAQTSWAKLEPPAPSVGKMFLWRWKEKGISLQLQGDEVTISLKSVKLVDSNPPVNWYFQPFEGQLNVIMSVDLMDKSKHSFFVSSFGRKFGPLVLETGILLSFSSGTDSKPHQYCIYVPLDFERTTDKNLSICVNGWERNNAFDCKHYVK